MIYHYWPNIFLCFFLMKYLKPYIIIVISCFTYLIYKTLLYVAKRTIILQSFLVKMYSTQNTGRKTNTI